MAVTKDAEKLICHLYKIYLKRRKEGESIEDAKTFSVIPEDDKYLIELESSGDLDSLAEELIKNNLLTANICDEYFLTSEAIVFMDEKFQGNIEKVVAYIKDLAGVAFGIF